MARVLTGEPFEPLLDPLLLIAGLLGLRAVLQLVRDEIGNAAAARMKVRVRGGLATRAHRAPGGVFSRAASSIVMSVDRDSPRPSAQPPLLIGSHALVRRGRFRHHAIDSGRPKRWNVFGVTNAVICPILASRRVRT